jgi:hypothetical protein
MGDEMDTKTNELQTWNEPAPDREAVVTTPTGYRYLIRWKNNIGAVAWNDGARWSSLESALEEARVMDRLGYHVRVVDTVTGMVQ